MTAAIAAHQHTDLRIDALPATADGKAWDDFVASQPAASAYHGVAWRRIIQEAFGHETHYLQASLGGAVAGVLPMARLRSRLFGDFLVSLPFVNYGGVLARDPAVAAALLDHAVNLARRLGVDHAEFRDLEPREGFAGARTDKAIFELALPDSADALFKQLGTKKRTRIRRAPKEGATVHHGGAELLDDFYAVFARNMRDLGTPVYHRGFFRTVLRHTGDQAILSVVRLHGQPVAAALLLGHRDRLEIPWASAVAEYNRYAVNMYLYWEVLALAIERGYRLFDFGRSTVGGSHQAFKEQFGARPRQAYWHYWLAPGHELPGLSPNNPRYALAIRLWQRLPLAVANRLGPHIVRYLP